jgi:hypothetical protein
VNPTKIRNTTIWAIKVPVILTSFPFASIARPRQ